MRIILPLNRVTALLYPLRRRFLALPTVRRLRRHRQIANDLSILAASGLFDNEFYLRLYKDVADRPLEHFYFNGAKEARLPNPYFETPWYLDTNKDVAKAGMHPLIHYIKYGEAEGRAPCRIFDPSWYRRSYRDAPGRWSTALAHFLHEGLANRRSPSPYFDVDFYLRSNPDVAASGIDPIQHFLHQGHKEGRWPNPSFDADFYSRNHDTDDTNPLLHYISSGVNLGHTTRASDAGLAVSLAQEQRLFTTPSADNFEELDASILQFRQPAARAIAFYLPQFHSIPENDAWWGKGFTEWRNVARGIPRFKGHYQPRIPRDLGFYDLENVEVMRRQIDMALKAGIYGFCYYFYWFNGKRVLDRPLEQLLRRTDIEFPFCIMWANENWTRTWDGLEQDVLLKQDYSESDEAALIAEFSRYFGDARYIRIDGRPLLIIYRPGVIPDAASTFQRWRKRWRISHDCDPIILMVQGFGDYDPRTFGLDGAIEFPPHKLAEGLSEAPGTMDVLDESFQGTVLRYDDLIRRAADVGPQNFPLVRAVVPSWDNEARRPGRGTTFQGSTPKKYEGWLRDAIRYARANAVFGAPLVFINAWNEWAEAAYLEPDVHYGAAYLNATARALAWIDNASKAKVVLVGHDCYPHGAQLLLLHIARTLRQQFGIDVAIVTLDGGPLIASYQEVAEFHNVSGNLELLERSARRLASAGYEWAIVNTTISGDAVPILKSAGFTTISLIHELPRLIAYESASEKARIIADGADRIVFASKYVADHFCDLVNDRSILARAAIRPQGLYSPWKSDPVQADLFRKELGLSDTDKLVINVGYADFRKGFDIFQSVAKILLQRRPDVHFAWIGRMEEAVRTWLLSDFERSDLSDRFHVVDFMENPVPAYEAANLFFLSSREDPFPTVVLEALRAGLAVVGLKDCSGSVDVVETYGRLADLNDPVAMAAAIEALIDASATREGDTAARIDFVKQHFRHDDYVHDLIRLFDSELRKVTAIVPNYNYERYLPARLNTIFDQSYPLFEVLLLDDCSTDGSLDVIDQYLSSTKRKMVVLPNSKNSGSAYAQWNKGARMARGEFVWIAEADDLAKPSFLREAMSLMTRKDVAFVFCNSAQIDEHDNVLAENYDYYFDQVERDAFADSFIMDGREFVRRFMSVRNLVLNVSGVVWRRDALLSALDATEHRATDMRLAVDWMMYVVAALDGRSVGFVHKALNVHRRHSNSVTHALASDQHLGEVSAVHDFIRARLGGDPELERRMQRYRTELKVQFGLSDSLRID